MEAAITAFATILRDLDARISALEATKAHENPARVDLEEYINLDNYSPDWVQDAMHILVSEITDAGKVAVFTYEQDYPRQAICDPEPKPDGTIRHFRNAGVAPLKIRLHGIWQTLLVLQPGESGDIIYSNGHWTGRDMYPDAWASLPTGGYIAHLRDATEEEKATFATEGVVIEITDPDGHPISTQTNYVWFESGVGKVGAACTHERFFTSCDPANAPISAFATILISVGGIDPSDAGVTFRVPII
jgi:hypothetical protein